jgi:hypothetical protein
MIPRGVRRLCCLVAVAFLVSGIASTGSGAWLRSIGLRVVLPLGDLPLLFGLEAAANVSFGVASATLFLSPEGDTVICLTGDVRLSSNPGPAEVFLRLTTGISYFDPGQEFPTPFLGAGLSYDLPIGLPITLGIAGELLYPLSFPAPFLTVTGRWTPE